VFSPEELTSIGAAMPRINRDDTADEIDRRKATGLSSLPVIPRQQLKSPRHWGEPRRLEGAVRLRGNAPPRRSAASHAARREAGPGADRGWDAGAVEVALAREDVARAIAEIEDAVEALRWQEPRERLPDEEEVERANHPWVWLRVAGMWASIGVAAAAMLGGLALLMR
jgi:hypothetical protein